MSEQIIYKKFRRSNCLKYTPHSCCMLARVGVGVRARQCVCDFFSTCEISIAGMNVTFFIVCFTFFIVCFTFFIVCYTCVRVCFIEEKFHLSQRNFVHKENIAVAHGLHERPIIPRKQRAVLCVQPRRLRAQLLLLNNQS